MIKISHIDQLRNVVSSQEEIREMDIGHDCVSFCYMISGPETFNTPEARECRGITFNSKGEVNSRSLHKFFNVNEREETLVQNLDWNKVVRVMIKRDGSMITSVLTEEGIKFKSKKTFTSDVALAATKWVENQPDQNVMRMCKYLHAADFTATFEWTSPTARIVVGYQQDELQLLHVRNNVTGEYCSSADCQTLGELYDVKVVEEPTFVVPKDKLGEHLIELAKTLEGIEGWVIQFEDGNMVKLKTAWYINLHHAIVFVRERDIVRLILDETLDDVKSKLVGEGIDMTEILRIEQDVIDDLSSLRHTVDKVILENSGLDRKSMAMKFQSHELFGLIMKAFSGSEPDYVGYFEKNIMKEKYGLNQINMINTVGEVE